LTGERLFLHLALVCEPTLAFPEAARADVRHEAYRLEIRTERIRLSRPIRGRPVLRIQTLRQIRQQARALPALVINRLARVAHSAGFISPSTA